MGELELVFNSTSNISTGGKRTGQATTSLADQEVRHLMLLWGFLVFFFPPLSECYMDVNSWELCGEVFFKLGVTKCL